MTGDNIIIGLIQGCALLIPFGGLKYFGFPKGHSVCKNC